jgi:hypothetical protein
MTMSTIERVWHHTTAAHLPWIMADGYLRPSRHILRNSEREGVVWFTVDGRKPDRTSTAGTKYPEMLWIRLGGSWPAMPWEDVCRDAGWLPDEIEFTRGTWAKASSWRAARGNVAIGSDCEVAAWRGGRWERIHPCIEMADDRAAAMIEWAGRSIGVVRSPESGPNGETVYAVKYL